MVDGPTQRLGRSTPRDQIDSGDYPYLVRGYPFNHVGSVGYCLGTGPNLPYIYMKGCDRLRTPKHIPIEPINYFIIISALGVDVCRVVLVVAFHIPTSTHIRLYVV